MFYRLDNEDIKHSAGAITEQQYCNPITMYGCNKLYCEKLGIYYSTHFHQLSEDYQNNLIDFRSIRFSGLISNITEPQGGTSDYIPQMLHAAARGETYQCFVNKFGISNVKKLHKELLDNYQPDYVWFDFGLRYIHEKYSRYFCNTSKMVFFNFF